jgi:hypothetical protein
MKKKAEKETIKVNRLSLNQSKTIQSKSVRELFTDKSG